MGGRDSLRPPPWRSGKNQGWYLGEDAPGQEWGDAGGPGVLAGEEARHGPDIILSSPLARALESAEVARKVFDAPVRTTEVLEPNRNSSEVFKFLSKEFKPSQRVMLITHFPLLTYLLVDLLRDSKESRIMFRPASMAAIECEPKPGKGKGKLFWLLAPDPV